MAMLAGSWDAPTIRRRVKDCLGRDRAPRWLTRLVPQVLELYPRPPLDRPRELAAVIQQLPGWQEALRSARPPRVLHWLIAPTEMAVTRWPVTPLVIRADLEAFFSSIAARRAYGILRQAGYPEAVAYAITGLCTTVVPRAVWQAIHPPADLDRHRRLGQFLAVPHLPQGAPTSPALANLVAFALDRRLSGLARAFDAEYTRYVDDLTFSGGSRLRAGRSALVEQLAAITADEGFGLVEAKTVVLGSSGRQQALGAVLNHHPTLSRPERDALRALLHNCATHGWRSQARGHEGNLPAHLLGRIGHVTGLDPALGAKLRDRYDLIDWT
jgi:RNA-directed DNA polymerase